MQSIAERGVFKIASLEESSPVHAGELRALVRMDQNPALRLSTPYGHKQSLQDHVRRLSALHCPADDTTGVEIDHDRQIGEAGQRIAIDLAAVLLCLPDKFSLPYVFLRPLAQRALQPDIESAGLDAKGTAHCSHRKQWTMLCYERVLHSLPGRRCLHRREGCISREVPRCLF